MHEKIGFTTERKLADWLSKTNLAITTQRSNTAERRISVHFCVSVFHTALKGGSYVDSFCPSDSNVSDVDPYKPSVRWSTVTSLV